jgi:hypothetical protein
MITAVQTGDKPMTLCLTLAFVAILALGTLPLPPRIRHGRRR